MLIDSKSELSPCFTYVLDTTFGTHKEIDNIAGTAGNLSFFILYSFLEMKLANVLTFFPLQQAAQLQ